MYKFLKDKTVLYIEDEDDIRENVTELISDHFGIFHTASDGEEGYEKFLDGGIDIVIVDIELPRMNGIELLRKIRQEDSKIHLVVISAHTKTEYLLDSIPFKLEQYLVKPLTSRKIKALLSTLNDAFIHDNVVQLVPAVLLDKDRATICFADEKHALTKKELSILTILADKKVITYDEIDLQWEDEVPSANAVRSCIKKIRQKLPENLLKTRSGVGYYIE
jgi:DNA-binding response OmpR family regulator